MGNLFFWSNREAIKEALMFTNIIFFILISIYFGIISYKNYKKIKNKKENKIIKIICAIIYSLTQYN